jgi:hypothetical protein
MVPASPMARRHEKSRTSLDSLATSVRFRECRLYFTVDWKSSGRGFRKNRFAVGYDLELPGFPSPDLCVLAKAGLE